MILNITALCRMTYVYYDTKFNNTDDIKKEVLLNIDTIENRERPISYKKLINEIQLG